MNITDKTGALVGIASVNDSNDLMVINKSGITLRVNVSDFRIMGRATQGVRLINLEKRNDQIASICCVDSDPDEEVDSSIVDREAQEVTEEVDAMLDNEPEEIETEEEIDEMVDELLGDDEAEEEEADDQSTLNFD